MKKNLFMILTAFILLFNSIPVFATSIDHLSPAEKESYLKLKNAIIQEKINLYEADKNGHNTFSTSSISGYGLISCFDGGAQTLVCDWSITLTNGDYIQTLLAEFTYNDSTGAQWGTDEVYKGPLGGNYKTYRDQIEHYMAVPGKYTATVTGAVEGREAIYVIAPVKSAEATLK